MVSKNKWSKSKVAIEFTPTADLEERTYEAIAEYQTIMTNKDTLGVLEQFSKYGTMIEEYCLGLFICFHQ